MKPHYTLERKQEKLKALEAELLVAKHNKKPVKNILNRIRVQRHYIKNHEEK